MVRLTMDLIARGTSGYTKKKRDENMQHYVRRLTHLYLENRGIDDVVCLLFKIPKKIQHEHVIILEIYQ